MEWLLYTIAILHDRPQDRAIAFRSLSLCPVDVLRNDVPKNLRSLLREKGG